MYINDIHILFYLSIGVIGLIVGQLIDWCNNRLAKYEKVLSKDFFTQYLSNATPQYLLMSITAISYVLVLYFNGLTVDTLKYVILIPMLACAFYVDLKEQIIPNRLNLLIFEIGLVLVFIYGFININISLNLLLGMLAGGGIFLIITLIGGLIAGKEAMGMGDVKLMGALGLFFGLQNIIVISVLAFLIGAIVSIVIMIIKRKGTDTYIPFGPFIVISSVITIFVPFSILFTTLMKIFTLGMY